MNAIDKGVDMFLAVRRLEDEWGQTKRHPLFQPGHFTIHPGVVTGGPRGALVPFFISEFMTAFSVDPEHPICTAVADAHERAAEGTRFAGRPAVNGFAAVEDVSFLNLGGVPAISYGPGDLRVAHADDEYILVDELITATKTYAILAMEWCGVA